MNQQSKSWQDEIEGGQRFGFGENWRRFLQLFNDDRIGSAEDSLKQMLEVQDLSGSSFLDVGSGSGLFSLAARRLGANVTSFDFDPQSVACTNELKKRYFPRDQSWSILDGSILDPAFLKTLGSFDTVYSWGVLHHTGSMWEAFANVADIVAQGGKLFIAIYNDQGRRSRRWRSVKRAYVRAPASIKWAILGPALLRLWGPTVVKDLFRGHPLRSWKSYAKRNSARGMDPWRDAVDWIGGYPFEVAKPEEVLDFFRARGFAVTKMVTAGGGLGCNEYVFERQKG